MQISDEEERIPLSGAAQMARGSFQARKIAVAELLGDASEIILVHAGQEYRLRITSNGKLLLTK